MVDTKEVEAALLKELAASSPNSSTTASVLKAVDIHVVQNDAELVITFHDLRAAQYAHRTLAELKDGPLFALLQPQAASLSVHYLTPEEASKVSSRDFFFRTAH